ncbi:hypothetical protein PM082_015028 [Marasmius tenuissimus]|nr:hypothetical protein PM082_015028 [Marasmius tenuissimus]
MVFSLELKSNHAEIREEVTLCLVLDLDLQPLRAETLPFLELRVVVTMGSQEKDPSEKHDGLQSGFFPQ